MNDDKIKEIYRLYFEDILWGIFVFLSFMNIIANSFQKEYVISNEQFYEKRANNISIFVLSVILFIYLYFFIRNIRMYINKGIDVTNEDLIKVIGSLFFVIGTICLLYFQVNSDDNFIGSLVI